MESLLREENYTPFDETSHEDAELASGPAQNYDYSLVLCLNEILTESQPFPGDGAAVDPTFMDGEFHFEIGHIDEELLQIYD